MMTTAKGRAVSAPTPVERAIGSRPEHRHQRGHDHRPHAGGRAFFDGLGHPLVPVAAQLAMIRVTRITLFWIEMPKSAMKPTSAATDMFSPAIGSAMMPPAAAKGTVRRTRRRISRSRR
jgi:hypothetical protein